MKKYLLGTLALAALVAGPAGAGAAMFAYVNQDGDVRSVEAANPNAALSTAPGIHMHSGVLLLDSSDDEDLVGDDVPGA
ncbi:MAG: hypothetical protein QOE22_714 [Candidatus Parcubacteria bacterium]|jgi:hypothetical protein|nr:hypothetical protein [Candidatus Parcubacteria bacterium]